MDFITKNLERKLGVDLNGDGVIGSGRGHGVAGGYNSSGHGGGGLVNKLEKATHMDLDGDGRIAGQPTNPPNYQQYGGLSYPPTYDPYGGPIHAPNANYSGGGGLINKLEKVTHMDLDGDGRIGGQPTYPPNYQQYGSPSYPPTYDPYGGPAYPPNANHSGGGGLINKLEKATHMDLDGDGRIAGQPAHPLNYQQYGSPSYPPTYDLYGGPAYPPNANHSGGGGLINKLEKATHMDLDGDGRIGGQPAYPQNYQQYGGPSYPPTYDQYGGPIHPTNYQQYSGSSYPPTYDQYGGPTHPPNSYHSGGGGLMNKLEKITNMDLNGDGRVGGEPGRPLNNNPYGYGH